MNTESFEDIYLQLRLRFATKFDSGHQIEHALIVASHSYLALKDFPHLTQNQKDAIIVAALMHDFNDHKFIPKSEHIDLHKLLSDYLPEETITLTVEMIELISCSKNGDTLISPSWMAIPRYADRLEAMGPIGLVRAISYANHINRPFIEEDTPKAYNEEQLDEICTYSRYLEYTSGKRDSGSTIDHLYDKILHLSVPKWVGSKTLETIAFERRNWLRKYILDYFNGNY